MKKFISEHKWNRIMDQIEAEYCSAADENGNVTFEGDNFLKMLAKQRETLDGYTIIGIRHQLSMIGYYIEDYKLRHLKLGKVRYDGKKFDGHSFEIHGMSGDILWQTADNDWRSGFSRGAAGL